MRTYVMKKQQVLARTRQEVFSFFEKPENLERITPASVGFTILTPRPIVMKVGAVLDYTIRLLGFPVRWTTLISQYDPPERFVDVALRGPYSFWHHTHTFEEDQRGTIMTDVVHYALPFGFLGRLVRFLWVKRQLDRIFQYRAEVIRNLLERPDRSTRGDQTADTDSESARS